MYDRLVNLFGDKKNNLFPGEKHVPLYTDKGFKIGQFMGPETQIVKRLRRGDKGLTDSDRTALVHDIEYTLANSPEDVRNADMRMLKTLDKIQERGSDYRINIEAGRRGIQGKLLFEKLSFLEKGSFSSKSGGRDLSNADKQLLQTTLNNMTQQGYGITTSDIKFNQTQLNELLENLKILDKTGVDELNRYNPRALYGKELGFLLKHIPHFVGVFAKDQLKNLKIHKNKQFCLVYNLNNSWEKGSHWCCINYQPKMKYKYIEHFDSFGIKPCREALIFMKSIKTPIHYQNNQLQQSNSNLCGFFCLEYLTERNNNKSPNEILELFTQNPSQWNEIKVIDNNF